MKRSVLVVDDNDINRLNLKLLLKDDYQVLEAGDLDAADAKLSGNRVDLVVLDLALPPEPDNPEIGIGYLKKLGKESPDTPVVVITGHDQRSLATKARKLGAFSVSRLTRMRSRARSTGPWRRAATPCMSRKCAVHWKAGLTWNCWANPRRCNS